MALLRWWPGCPAAPWWVRVGSTGGASPPASAQDRVPFREQPRVPGRAPELVRTEGGPGGPRLPSGRAWAQRPAVPAGVSARGQWVKTAVTAWSSRLVVGQQPTGGRIF